LRGCLSARRRRVGHSGLWENFRPSVAILLHQESGFVCDDVITLHDDESGMKSREDGFVISEDYGQIDRHVNGRINDQVIACYDEGSLSLSSDWDVEDFLEKSEKLKYVNTISDAGLILDKDSPGNKLLHSLIYELSKTAATFCPFDPKLQVSQTSQYFANVFESFWACVPYLQKLHSEGVLPGDKATSKYKNLKSLLRWKMQKNFGVLMRKYNVRYRINLGLETGLV
jgi:hypothetical protein